MSFDCADSQVVVTVALPYCSCLPHSYRRQQQQPQQQQHVYRHSGSISPHHIYFLGIPSRPPSSLPQPATLLSPVPTPPPPSPLKYATMVTIWKSIGLVVATATCAQVRPHYPVGPVPGWGLRGGPGINSCKAWAAPGGGRPQEARGHCRLQNHLFHSQLSGKQHPILASREIPQEVKWRDYFWKPK